MQPIPLEDGYTDILTKVVRGRKLKLEDVAQQAGIDLSTLNRLLDGDFDEASARRLAPALELGPDSLVAMARQTYQPQVEPLDGLAAFNTPYHDFFVNAFLIWDPKSKKAVAFDTGADAAPILKAAETRGLTIELVLLTHIHPDHIACLEDLKKATGARAFVSDREPTVGAEPFADGKAFEVGGLRIESKRTSGHSKGGTSYLVTGLARPVVVVGDALFAGSMGGGIVSYPEALATNRQEIFTLPDDTVICPGHGPLTTVALEKRHNPFYPEFQ